MRRRERGQATIEWLATVMIALAIVSTLALAGRGVIDPGAAVAEALGLISAAEERPPSIPPAFLVRGAPGDPPLGRAIRGGGRIAGAGVRAAGRGSLRAGRGLLRAVGPQVAAFVRGFRARLAETIRAAAAPPTLRALARRALNGLWEATPYAQAIRNAIAGGRIVVAGIRARSLAAASEQAGREAADRVLRFLGSRARSLARGRARREPASDPPARPRRTSGAEAATRP